MAPERVLNPGGPSWPAFDPAQPPLAPSSLPTSDSTAMLIPPPQTEQQTSSSSFSSFAAATTRTQPQPSQPPQPPKRHCWECLRRRLVCDGGQPFCRKCDGAGVVCPGYDDKKPLRWIANGTVSSRPRKNGERKNGKRKKKELVAAGAEGAAAGTVGTVGTVGVAERVKANSKARRVGVRDGGGRGDVREVVVVGSKMLEHATAETTPSPAQEHKSQTIFRREDANSLTVPPHIDLRSSTSDVVQAAYYCKLSPLHPVHGHQDSQLTSPQRQHLRPPILRHGPSPRPEPIYCRVPPRDLALPDRRPAAHHCRPVPRPPGEPAATASCWLSEQGMGRLRGRPAVAPASPPVLGRQGAQRRRRERG